MITRYLIAAGLSMALHSAIAAPIEPIVVKTYSGTCGRSDQTLIGSGVLVRDRGNLYVLTSEHALVHAPGDAHYCHKILDENQNSYTAKLLAVDWGTGLGVLQLTSESATQALKNQNVPTVDALRIHSSLVPSDAVKSLGFAQAQNAISSTTGKILTPKGNRHLIPFLKRSIETIDVHGEYGMSGGALVDAAGNYQGMISHQYFTLSPGEASPVREFSMASGDQQNYLLVIPADEVWAWFDRVLNAGKDFAPTFMRDPDEQLGRKDTESVISENVRFQFTSVNQRGSALIAKKGGGHGAGVTGLAREDRGMVNISVTRRSTETHYSIPSTQLWFSRIQSEITAGRQLSVTMFIPKNSDVKEPLYFGSLAEFAHHLAQNGLSPLANGGAIENHASQQMKRTSADLKVWIEKASLKAKTFNANDSASAEKLIRELTLLEAALESADFGAVNESWVKGLVESRPEAWSAFMSDEAEVQSVVSIISSLRELLTIF